MTTSNQTNTSTQSASKSQEKNANSEFERIESIAKEMNLKKGDIIVLRNENGKIVEAIVKTLILLLASTFICWQIWQIRVVANRMLAQQQLEFTILCRQLSTSCSEKN